MPHMVGTKQTYLYGDIFHILSDILLIFDANFKQQQRPEDEISDHSADVETGRPLHQSLRPVGVLPSEGYYTLFFGFHFSQTALFAQTALYFSRFDVIILEFSFLKKLNKHKT